MSERYKTIRTYIELFLFYCMTGWVYEVVWCNLIDHNRGFINNGFLFGPWLPIYGFGTSIILFLIHKYKIDNKWMVFFIGAVFSTIAELLGSYFLDIVAGKGLWDYSNEFLNLQGRIALKPSINFGLLILIAYLITPKLKKILTSEKFDNMIHDSIFIVVMVLFCVDAVVHLIIGSNR